MSVKRCQITPREVVSTAEAITHSEMSDQHCGNFFRHTEPSSGYVSSDQDLFSTSYRSQRTSDELVPHNQNQNQYHPKNLFQKCTDENQVLDSRKYSSTTEYTRTTVGSNYTSGSDSKGSSPKEQQERPAMMQNLMHGQSQASQNNQMPITMLPQATKQHRPPLSPFIQQKPQLSYQTPLKQQAPDFYAQRQHILNKCSKEDKQFFEDLKYLESKQPVVGPKKERSAAKKTKSSVKKQNFSQDGDTAKSFKSMTSYILGDLDISENEEEASEFGSLELSSNSGTEGSCRGPQNNEETFGGFISKQSPFSFKNPIFFTCPNQKVGMARKINAAQVGNCRKQLFTKQIQKLHIKEVKTPVVERKPLKIQTEQMHRLQQDIVESPISKNKYKNIAREMKECEKANDPYQMVVKNVLTKMITVQMPKKI